MRCSDLLHKIGAKPGDKIKVETTKGIYSGVLLPSSNFLEIKLSNGYNVGFMAESVKGVSLVERASAGTKKNSDKKTLDSKLPLIFILHTGGTIASKVDYSTGGVSPSIDSEEIISAIPEISKIANIKSVLVSNVLSEEIGFQHYGLFAKAVKNAIEEKPKGIIITHGTDTMHYSASAMSFIFENLPLPVIFVGSQRSSDRPSTDAKLNMINAAKFITKTDFVGVAICMHADMSDDSCYILPGTKSRKMHSTRRDAFRAINSSPIAKVSQESTEYLQKYQKYAVGPLKINDKFEERVAILRARPGLRAEEIKFFEQNEYKGLIIEGTGMGHIAISEGKNTENLDAIKSLIDSGCVVCMTTQCIFGRTNPNVYSTGRRLKEVGVIFLEDMTTETAYIKLSWLLGNFGIEKAKDLMQKNLRGEINERSGLEFL